MTTAAAFISARVARDEAKARLDDRIAAVRADVEARGVGGRIADRVTDEAASVLDEGLELFDAHRGVVAGTIAALALWFLRHPIIAGIDAILGGEDEEED